MARDLRAIDLIRPSASQVNIGKILLLLIGIVGLAAGLFFVGQGFEFINWPASSFMNHETRWVYHGGAIAVAGLVLTILSRR